MKKIILILIICLSPILADKIVITILYNNIAYNKDLTTAWGFSCFIKGLEKNILFDTGGDGEILLDNMEKLKIEPVNIDIIFLSHIHHDHVGALWNVIEKNSEVTVYLLKSFPEEFKGRVKKSGAILISVDKPIEICDNVFSNGELGGIWIKEQSLIINTKKGLIIVTGCAHPGIVNIVKTAKELLNKNIYLVMGGFHLRSYSENEVKNIIKELKELEVTKVGPSHCTGGRPIELFRESWGEDFFYLGCGAIFELEFED